MQLSGKVVAFDPVKRQGEIYCKAKHGNVRVTNAGIEQTTQLAVGDTVQFELGFAGGVGQALRVVVVSSIPVPAAPAPAIKEQPGDKDKCASCLKQMVPRMVFENGLPARSFCPFCGGVHKDFTEESFASKAGKGIGAVLVSGLLGSLLS